MSKPDSRRLLTFAPLLLAAAAGCTTRGENSFIIPQQLTLPTGTSKDPLTPCSTSTCPTGTTGEQEGIAFETFLDPCVTVENRLPSNQLGTNRLNSNDFLIEEVHVSFEATNSTSSVPSKEFILPANGFVPAGNKASIPMPLIASANAATVAAGTTVRLRFHLEGKLLDGSKVKSAEYSYITTRVAGGDKACNPGS